MFRFLLLFAIIFCSNVVNVKCNNSLEFNIMSSFKEASGNNINKSLKSHYDQSDDRMRYLTHLSTDKPIYKINEKVLFRGVFLHALDHSTLLKISKPLSGKLIIKNAKESVEARLAITIEEIINSSFGYEYEVPSNAAGGEWSAEIVWEESNFPSTIRKFFVREIYSTKLKLELKYGREGYTASENVEALLSFSRIEGGNIEDVIIKCRAMIDEENEPIVVKIEKESDGKSAKLKFQIPSYSKSDKGTLSCSVRDDGVVESVAKSIPIIMNNIDIGVFPESNEFLINGVQNRVYVQGRNTAGDPVDFAADIVKIYFKNRKFDGDVESVEIVASVNTVHEGRGVSTFFKAEIGTKYELRVTAPRSVSKKIVLPKVMPGAVLSSPENKYSGKDSLINLSFASCYIGSYVILVSRRELGVASKAVSIDGKNKCQNINLKVDLPISFASSGILRVSVFDAFTRMPIAERLIFREAPQSLQISVVPSNKEAYSIGANVSLTIHVVDEENNPVTSFLGVTVTDDGVLSKIEKRRRAPKLLSNVYLESEIEELFDEDAYLPNSSIIPTMDLLLAVQGWRRFIYEDVPASFISQKHKVQVLDQLYGFKNYNNHRSSAFSAHYPYILTSATATEPRAVAGIFGGNKGITLEIATAAMQPQALNGNMAKNAVGDEFLERGNAVLDDVGQWENDGDDQEEIVQIVQNKEDNFGDNKVKGIRAPKFIRVYAHSRSRNKKSSDEIKVRNDFTDTLYFQHGLETDSQGNAEVSFQLCDSITNFRVLVEGYAYQGQLIGENNDLLIQSKLPLNVDVLIPNYLVSGDKVIATCNVISEESTTSSVTSMNVDINLNGPWLLQVESAQNYQQSKRMNTFYLPIGISQKETGNASISVSVKSSNGKSDKIKRETQVIPSGFPVIIAESNVLSVDEYRWSIDLPHSVLNHNVVLSVFPTVLSNMVKALEALIREPSGCFEQSSSTVYPLIMAMQYFVTHPQVDSKIVKEAEQKLKVGYKKLLSFESPNGGYEWFGRDPGHEALTAYALLEFNDLASVMEIEEVMVKRTKDWLLSRRGANGSFQRDTHSIDSFGRASGDVTNSYILYALSNIVDSNLLDVEITHMLNVIQLNQDPYILALVANTLQNFRIFDKNNGESILDMLTEAQDDNGVVKGAKESITQSGGKSLNIETTSLSILCWLRNEKYVKFARKSIKWLSTQSEGGKFGSTQSTVLALKAIIEYDKLTSKFQGSGKIDLKINNNLIETISYQEGTESALEFNKELIDSFLFGAQRVNFSLQIHPNQGGESKIAMFFSFVANLQTLLPLSDPINNPLSLNVKMSQESLLIEGDSTEMIVNIQNNFAKELPMTILILGIPGGMEMRYDQLEEMKRRKDIAYYEIIKNELIFYFDGLGPKQKISLRVDLLAKISGDYTGPSSRAYLYYTDEIKTFAKGVSVSIVPLEMGMMKSMEMDVL